MEPIGWLYDTSRLSMVSQNRQFVVLKSPENAACHVPSSLCLPLFSIYCTAVTALCGKHWPSRLFGLPGLSPPPICLSNCNSMALLYAYQLTPLFFLKNMYFFLLE